MAKRNVETRRIDSAEVMGEGSYVVLKPVKYGRIREAIAMSQSGDNAAGEQLLASLIVGAVVEWDWVDDDEQPLPAPTKPEDLDELYTEEVKFLTAQILPTAKELKN